MTSRYNSRETTIGHFFAFEVLSNIRRKTNSLFIYLILQNEKKSFTSVLLNHMCMIQSEVSGLMKVQYTYVGFCFNSWPLSRHA